MTTDAALRRTPLYEGHRGLGARMVPFAGYEMPIQYAGIVAEHRGVREAAGLFDLSHMGEFHFEGPAALAAVDRLVSSDIAGLAVGQARYGLLCNERGTIVDDVIVYRTGADHVLMVVNAANIEKDEAHVRRQLKKDVAFADRSADTALIAIQGPRAADILARIAGGSVAALPPFGVKSARAAGAQATIARTGYTGEDGFEIYVPSNPGTSAMVWNEVLESGRDLGVIPCGLGARNTLRLEAKLPLYGHEISDTINVWEAGLERFCKLEKGNFIGHQALCAAQLSGIRRTLIGLEMIDRGIARDGYKVLDGSAREIGYVTSGSYAPFLKKNIALAYVPPQHSQLESCLQVEIRGQGVAAKVVPTPFYKRPRVKVA